MDALEFGGNRHRATQSELDECRLKRGAMLAPFCFLRRPENIHGFQEEFSFTTKIGTQVWKGGKQGCCQRNAAEKRGTLRSGKGGFVKSREQAIAIGLSEARKKGAKVPERSHLVPIEIAPDRRRS